MEFQRVPLKFTSRDQSVLAHSQWETTLHCNVVSHWLSAYTKWSLHKISLSCCRDHSGYGLSQWETVSSLSPSPEWSLMLVWLTCPLQASQKKWDIIVRRAGLLWSQEDFEWRRSVPLFKCLTVLEFSFILFDLCLLITFFNFIMNYVPIVTFWIFTYHKIWILSIMFCSIWSYWIIYFLACLEVSWRVVS